MPKPFSSMPGPRSYPLLGTVPHYISGRYSRDSLHRTGLDKYREFGPVVRETVLPGTDIVWLFDPVDIRTMYKVEGRCPERRSHLALEHYRTVRNADRFESGGLLPTNGPAWEKMRKEFQPMLTPSSIEEFLPATVDVCRDFVQMVGDKVEKGEGRLDSDFLEELKKYFLEVTGLFLFDKRLGAISAELDPHGDPRRLMDAALDTNENILHTDNGLPLWKLFETKEYAAIRKGQECIEEITAKLLADRDTIPRLPHGGSDLSRNDVHTFFADMMLAGIDTGAYTASFLLYHLSKNSSAQDKLRAECESIGGDDGDSTTDLMKNMRFGKLALKESLRLNPVSVGTGRILPVDAEFGGYEVPKGTVLVTQNQVSCRLPEYFDNPDDFIPERWDRSGPAAAGIDPYLSLPFGHGRRACIGRRLAEQSLVVLMHGIFSQFRLQWVGQERELDCVSKLINKPDAPLLFNFEKLN